MTTISVENPIVNDLDEAKRSATNENRDEGRGNNDDEKEDYEENSGGEGALHSSTATITSSTASHASSSESRKSRRASLRREKLGSCLFRSYDPMQVVTQEQLDAFSL